MGSRNRISQWLIDFCESRTITAQSVGEKRALKYGDFSWQWRWTFKQERIWEKLSWWSLVNI